MRIEIRLKREIAKWEKEALTPEGVAGLQLLRDTLQEIDSLQRDNKLLRKFWARVYGVNHAMQRSKNDLEQLVETSTTEWRAR